MYGIADGTLPTKTCNGCEGKGWVEVSDVSQYPVPGWDYWVPETEKGGITLTYQVSGGKCPVCHLEGEHCALAHAAHDHPDVKSWNLYCSCPLHSPRY